MGSGFEPRGHCIHMYDADAVDAYFLARKRHADMRADELQDAVQRIDAALRAEGRTVAELLDAHEQRKQADLKSSVDVGQPSNHPHPVPGTNTSSGPGIGM